MSEEILKALMQLFALITKQDGGIGQKEILYVENFLTQQLGNTSAASYLELFHRTAADEPGIGARSSGGPDAAGDRGSDAAGGGGSDAAGTHHKGSDATGDLRGGSDTTGDRAGTPTSVLDSVRVLKLCRQISRTLNQRQKVIVLLRILELMNSEYKLSEQRLGIVQTVADIFRIGKAEYSAIFDFVTSVDPEKLRDENHLVVSPKRPEANDLPLTPGKDKSARTSPARHYHFPGLDQALFFLRVPSVDLYFLKYNGEMEGQLNGLGIHRNIIYLFASGSTLRMPVGQPLLYSDIAGQFMRSAEDARIQLEAVRVEYEFPGGVKGLDQVSFQAEQGNLVGILGSSGAGKTTLMNVLSGVYTPSGGQVLINGLDQHREAEKLQGVSGFVPQDDLLIEELSVFDNLYFAARFCFRGLPDAEIREKVKLTLQNLGLYDKRELRVGSVLNKTISGGQRKRLNIALELIREPSVLFLDEPTSGLSSRDSENVMDLLRELTLKGKLVFVVIHQPSSELYKMFDRVVILDQGGKLIYFGNPVEAVIHFKKADRQINADIGECPVCGNVNPELIFNIVEAMQVDDYGHYTDQRKVDPESWETTFREANSQNLTGTKASGEGVPNEEIPKQRIAKEGIPKYQHTGLKAPPVSLKVPGWLSQFGNYLRRDVKSKLNNIQYLLLTLLVSPLLAFILAFIIRYNADPVSQNYVFRDNENIPIYIFMALIVALFLGLILSAEEIFRDRKILKRERFLHLSRSSYLLAKISTLVLISALQSILFVLVANSILEIRGMTLPYWLALFSTAVCANLIGLVISSAFNSAVTIYILIPLVMIPMMVLSGAMFSFEKLNRKITRVDKVPLVAELMPTKWSYEALMVHQFKDNAFEENFYDYEKRISYYNFKSAYLIPELIERLNDAYQEYQTLGRLEASLPRWTVLQNEIPRWQDAIADIHFQKADLDPARINDATFQKAYKLLALLKKHYIDQFSMASREKERHLGKLMQDRRDLYYAMLDRHHNESVADQVKKIYEKNQIIEDQGRLYQQIDPIFLDPEPRSPLDIRSHFFAPRKHLLGRYIDTYRFNIGFIWFLSLLLYVILYFDLLSRLVNNRIFKRRKG